ncbi:MAG TPA: PLP-dependent transferase, partial [Pseudomonadota bacterium]|nr:PLP-dependent transferase [Pseudomonadota bacterium]
AGITQGMIRLAVGLEDIRDLQADLQRGLASLAP